VSAVDRLPGHHLDAVASAQFAAGLVDFLGAA
jgi:hypothetical protein